MFHRLSIAINMHNLLLQWLFGWHFPNPWLYITVVITFFILQTYWQHIILVLSSLSFLLTNVGLIIFWLVFHFQEMTI
jgi:hypothetical protein